MALSIIGTVAAVVFLILLCFRGYSPIMLAPFAGFIIAMTAGLSFKDYVSTFGGGFATSISGVILTYMFCIVFAELMKKSRSAYSIANWIAEVLGPQYACLVCVIGAGILTIGGMTVGGYAVAYPIGLMLASKANYCEDAIPAACMAGPWTFGILMPLCPSIHNSLAMQYLGTTNTAGLIPGLLGGLVMFVGSSVFLQWRVKSWQKQGRGFTAWDKIQNATDAAPEDYPPVWRAFLPIVVVMVLYNVFKQDIRISIVAGCATNLLLERKTFGKDWLRTIETAAIFSLRPMTNVSIMAAVGKCVAATPFYAAILEYLGVSTVHPYILVLIATSVFGLCTGSASAALSASLATLQPIFETWAAQGFSMGALHRIAVYGSDALCSLPHAGAIASATTIFNTTYKKAYGCIFVVCVIMVNIAAWGVVLPLCMAGLA